ncbi:MAG: phosphoribosylaminoimidazolesuccinocarboxamide synthase [Patescibacteria group bacterium]
MNPFEKDTMIIEGKTKKVYYVKGNEHLAIFENKPDVTAFDDPKFTKQFEAKATYATTTTCRVFELLKDAGIPVAYKQRLSASEFLALRCNMIPLEVVGRRLAVGSYLKRHPELALDGALPPHRFHRLVAEFFLKTTGGKLIGRDGEILIEGLDPSKGEEDPFIPNPFEPVWQLFHSKKPTWDNSANLERTLRCDSVAGTSMMQEMEKILRRVFFVLEGAWNTLGYRLVDLKIEFGITTDGNCLVVADVIDNDSWRLRDATWQELSKQLFREGAALDEVEEKYGFVASLVERFRIPKQVMVLWRASTKDDFPITGILPGVEVQQITLSGHKYPQVCLDKLEEIMRNYPDGGAIVVKVGMSNGLGPMLAARTTWPVITIPASTKDAPSDVWSSLHLPSLVPMATILSDKNAFDFALNVLSAKNPAVYMHRQFANEQLDK